MVVDPKTVLTDFLCGLFSLTLLLVIISCYCFHCYFNYKVYICRFIVFCNLLSLILSRRPKSERLAGKWRSFLRYGLASCCHSSNCAPLLRRATSRKPDLGQSAGASTVPRSRVVRRALWVPAKEMQVWMARKSPARWMSVAQEWSMPNSAPVRTSNRLRPAVATEVCCDNFFVFRLIRF